MTEQLQREFFEPESLPAGWELLVPAERAPRVFTAERVLRNQQRADEILRCVSSGQSIRATARAFSVSPNTVAVLMRRRPDVVEALRLESSGMFRVLSRISVERLIESIDNIPLQVLPALAGIAHDKAQAADGFATQVIDVKRPAADPKRFESWIDAQVVDAQVVAQTERPAAISRGNAVRPDCSPTEKPATHGSRQVAGNPLPDSESGDFARSAQQSEPTSAGDAPTDAVPVPVSPLPPAPSNRSSQVTGGGGSAAAEPSVV
jgi:hypothetical protein